MIGEKEKMAMFDDDIYLDYESIVNDTDPLYDDEENYSDDEYDYMDINEREFDSYYHTIANELID
jgi:hypothetical protein